MRALVADIVRSPARVFLFIFLLSFAVRSVLLLVTPIELVLEPGAELGAVARTLAQTGQFANPFSVPTGPTAHLPPIYAGMVALIYRLFGMAETAGYVRCLLIMAAYSAMYASVPWLAGRLGVGRNAGVLGGVAGALTPSWPAEVSLAWEEPYAAMALGLLLVVFLRRWTGGGSSCGPSFLLGMASGAVFHLSPNLLPVVLGCMAFELAWSRDRRKWARSAVMVLGMMLACVPWGWRNYEAFHEIFFVRSNLGLELRMGNHDGADADFDVTAEREGPRLRHPLGNLEEAAKVRALGEMEYMRQARREALEWIRTHPGAFLRLTALRVIQFWCGPLHQPRTALGVCLLSILAFLGARRTLPLLTAPQKAALVLPLATYPLIYYVVGYTMRYRVPLNWILLTFAGAEVWHWIRPGSPQDSSRTMHHRGI